MNIPQYKNMKYSKTQYSHTVYQMLEDYIWCKGQELHIRSIHLGKRTCKHKTTFKRLVYAEVE